MMSFHGYAFYGSTLAFNKKGVNTFFDRDKGQKETK